MTILVDLDDVLMSLMPYWCKWLNKYSKYKVKEKDIKQWDITSHYPDLTKDQIYAPLFNKEFWKTTRPIKSSIKYVNQLIKDGHEVYICTATHYASLKDKLENGLLRYFNCFNYKNIITNYNKHLMKADILIDDYPENLKDFEGIRILFNKSYNKNSHESYFDVRCDSWKEIYNYINQIIKLN